MDIYEALEKFRKNKKRDSWLECIREISSAAPAAGLEYVRTFRKECKQDLKEDPNGIMKLLRESYIMMAPYFLDDYIIAMEWDRPSKNQFYLPRRKALLSVVSAIQELADDKLDILCVSMPPGTGKSALEMFAMTWLGGRCPEEGMLLSSHNNDFLKGAYEEVLRELTSEDYNWKEIFPGKSIASTNAKDMKIAVDISQRFPTFQFTSIGAGNAGKVRALQLLCCDDLISGIEEAMSKERLDSKWQSYTVDLKQRKQGDHCKELHIATRWSVHDIIGRIERQNEGNPRAKFIAVPALNENGESNFDYGGANGFTTKFYEEIRESMDDVSFRALYMNEPIEREGLLYSYDSLETFYELPSGDPDCILGVCDTAEGGGDNTVLPIFYVYGNKHYLWDVVDSNSLPEVTQPMCAKALVQNKVDKVQFESNSAGGRFADCVNDIVKSMNGHTHITKRRTTTNKETKIIVESDWVKKNVVFRDKKVIEKGSMYDRFMNGMLTYTVAGKNKHDDEVDAISQYARYYRTLMGSKIELIDRRNFGI